MIDPAANEAIAADLLGRAWQRTLGRSRQPWVSAVSPPFPAEWPPRRGTPAFYYGYATRVDHRVCDAVYLTRPFARVRFAVGRRPVSERLSWWVRQQGLQGVEWLPRPPDPAGRQLATLERLLAWCAEGAAPAPEGLDLVGYYGFWLLALPSSMLRPRHEPFFRWLDHCAAKARAWGALTVIGGPLSGQSFDLSEEITTIGSRGPVDVLLSDPSISARHAGIKRHEAGDVELADLASESGTYVNEVRCLRTFLRHGDRIRVGSTELRFELARARAGVGGPDP